MSTTNICVSHFRKGRTVQLVSERSYVYNYCICSVINVTQPLDDDILFLACTGVNGFWDVGAKMAESSELEEIRLT